MIKKAIKYLFYKVYQVGKFEELRIKDLERSAHFEQNATIDPTVHLADDAKIYNESKDKSKINIGKHTRIMGHLFVYDHGGQINIGESCFLGPLSRIWSAAKITIGNRVLIAHNVNIHDNISHPLDAKKRHEEFVSFATTGLHDFADLKGEEIIIEDDVWIGFNSIILRGVRIGRGAIIGAGSTVTKDVEPWTVNVGSPLRCVSKLEPVEVPCEKSNHSSGSSIGL